MTTGAPASEQTKAKYSAAEPASRVRTGLASDWRTWLIGALIVLIIGYFWYARRQAAETATTKVARPMVPVSAVRAQRGDLNLYLTAIGTVTPFNTTTIKSRVDGAIAEHPLQRRTDREGRRSAHPDRSPSLSGSAHAGGGPDGQGPGHVRRRRRSPSSAIRFCIRKACSRASISTISSR